MAGKIDGIALGALGAGVGLLYLGITGKDILSATKAVISGKSPATAAVKFPITAPSGSAGNAGSTGGSPVGVGHPSTASQQTWASLQLISIGAVPTPAGVQSLIAWANHESPWNTSPPDGAEYTHNPLNTTEQQGAIGEVNSVNVAIYPDWATGIRANAMTLLGGYPDIVARLRSGQGLCGWSSPEFSTWSGGGYSSVC